MTQNEAQSQFFQLIAANLDYWLEQTQELAQRDLSQLDADRQNIYQAIQYGLAFSQTSPKTIRLVLQCWLFIERRGYWHDWIAVLEKSIERCGQADLDLKGQLLNRLGQSQRLDGQWAAAVTQHQRAKAIAQQTGNELLAAQATYYLCYAYRVNERHGDAKLYGQEALAAFEAIAPDSFWVGAACNELGLIALWQGDLELAERYFGRSITRWRQVDDPAEVGGVLINLGLTMHYAGRLDASLAYYREAIPLLSAAGSEIRKILVQTNLGSVYYQQGDYVQAEKTFRAVDLVYLRRVGNLHYQAVVAQSLGAVALAEGRLETAESYLRQSHALWLKMDDPINLANTVGSIAEVMAARGNIGEAVPWYEEACQRLSAYPEHIRAQRLLKEFTTALAALTDTKTD